MLIIVRALRVKKNPLIPTLGALFSFKEAFSVPPPPPPPPPLDLFHFFSFSFPFSFVVVVVFFFFLAFFYLNNI